MQSQSQAQSQSQSRSRKRAPDGSAPDASFQYPQMQDAGFNQTDPLSSFRNPLSNDSFADFAAYDSTNNVNANAANFFPSQLTSTQAPTYSPSVAPASNQLVRRNTNQQVARTPQRNQWTNFTNPPAQQQTERLWENMEEEDDLDLDQKAALAKKDAQAKRKQIPPFVQKLSSFLDSSNNTELIRWSDDGNSFIVLDEDEFARTLIPELFKHNNYASFVRQLNMYGFHKKVGLNANSMKAAEKKVKDPSVYWHEYFKRGRPDLLWLIQKPQAKSSGSKRKRDQERREGGESDDDVRRQSPDTADSGQVSTIPRTEMQTFRSELQTLQRQQSVISKMISQLKEQNEQFYRQATAFQALHDRHENSINAILTFLATFYNRSLEGHAGQNLVNMFNGPPMPAPQVPQQGSVFDVGDDSMADSTNNNQQLQRYLKRPLLLPAPANQFASLSPSTNPLSARSSPTPARDQQQRHNVPASSTQPQSQPQPQPQPQPQSRTAPQRASVTPVIKDDAETPNMLNAYPENDEIMNFITSMNANGSPNAGGGPNLDFPAALDHLHTANGNSPLTAEQRNNMLSMIAGQGAPSTSQPGANNALVTPTPPPMPNLEQFNRNRQQLDALSRMQQAQDSKVQDLAGRLQPLSPTGAIPGIADRGAGFDPNDPNGDLSEFDIDNFIEGDGGYFPTFDSTSSAPPVSSAQAPTSISTNPTADPNTDLDSIWDFTQHDGLGDTDDLFGEAGGGINEEESGRVVGSVSSEGTSPAAPIPTLEEGEDGTPSKRRKTGT